MAHLTELVQTFSPASNIYIQSIGTASSFHIKNFDPVSSLDIKKIDSVSNLSIQKVYPMNTADIKSFDSVNSLNTRSIDPVSSVGIRNLESVNTLYINSIDPVSNSYPMSSYQMMSELKTQSEHNREKEQDGNVKNFESIEDVTMISPNHRLVAKIDAIADCPKRRRGLKRKSSAKYVAYKRIKRKSGNWQIKDMSKNETEATETKQEFLPRVMRSRNSQKQTYIRKSRQNKRNKQNKN